MFICTRHGSRSVTAREQDVSAKVTARVIKLPQSDPDEISASAPAREPADT